MQKITQEKIEHLHTLYEELEALREKLNLADMGAKTNKENVVTLTRDNGEVVELQESVLWEEVYQLRDKTEAYAFLRAKYPGVFEASDAFEAKVKEITEYGVTELEINPIMVRLTDIIRLVDAIYDYKQAQSQHDQ